MRGGELAEALERGDDALVGGNAARQVLAEDGLEAHAVQVGGRAHVAGGLELREAVVDRPAVVGHALVAALGEQRRLPRPVEAKQTELEGGRTEVGDKNLHGTELA